MKPTCIAARMWPRLTVAVALVASLTLLLAGCGGGSGAPSAPILSLTLGYYYVTATGLLPLAATLGDQVQLLAAGNTAGGGQVALTNKATWHSSDPAVATVDANGMLTARAAGSTQVSATYGSFATEPLTVTVNAPGATPTADYYPFYQANQWVYTGTEVFPAQATPPETLTITTQQQVVLEGRVWWELQINYTDPKTPPGFMYLRHDARGLQEVYYVRQGSENVAHYYYRLQEPLTAGAHWVDVARPEHYWDLLSTTASLTVPAAFYEGCFQVREHDVATDGTPFDTIAWFAPTVGLIRTETTAPDPVTGDPVLHSEQSLLRAQLFP